MSVDENKWRFLGTAKPETAWKPILNAGSPALSTAVESFLVEFLNLSNSNQPDYLYRSGLGIRVLYPQGRYFLSDIQTRNYWLRPGPRPKELTIEFPTAMLKDGTIFRAFECRRWNRWNRMGYNTDGAWEINLYESLQQRYLDDFPPPDEPPTGPEWVWNYG